MAALMSGGGDSHAVAFAAQHVGKAIHAYTFHLQGHPTFDSSKAQDTAEKMGWPCTLTQVPTSDLKQDFFRLYEFGCVKKTQYESCFPFLYVFPEIRETEVLSGLAAEGHFGTNKQCILRFKEPKAKLDQWRDAFFKPESRSAYLWHKRIAESSGKRLIAPFATSQAIRAYFKQFDFNQLNKPMLKHHVTESFPEFRTLSKTRSINLQLGAGIDKLFESLLHDDDINFKHRSRMLDVYRDWKTYKPKVKGWPK